MMSPWTNVYGLARSLLATALALTLLIDGVDVLFQPLAFKAAHAMVPVYRLSLFYLLSGSRAGLEVARWISISVLLVVASGWRPRFTGVAHWWIAFSFAASTTVAEGGDQVHAIIALLLVPVTLMDARRSHWESWAPGFSSTAQQIRATLARSCFTLIRLQVALIYFHAGVAKLYAPEWPNGTAVYYWFTHPVFGMSGVVRELASPLLNSGIGVAALTWGTILLEITLASALVMERRHFPVLLKVGILFHFGIILAHGLFSFFLVMSAALVLYLRPVDQRFSLRPPPTLAAWLVRLRGWAARGLPGSRGLGPLG
jgi:antimicrobial peptide system SdpB family protein